MHFMSHRLLLLCLDLDLDLLLPPPLLDDLLDDSRDLDLDLRLSSTGGGTTAEVPVTKPNVSTPEDMVEK